MRYLISALKYIKDNYIILLPSLAVAILAFAPAIDYSAMQHITQSFADGKLTSRFSDWLKLFMPFNSENWATVLLTLAAYVALVLDVAYTHSMVDKHIRFGSKSFRSIISSFTINFIYGFICMVVLILSIFVLAVLMALIMSAFALAPAYVFIVAALRRDNGIQDERSAVFILRPGKDGARQAVHGNSPARVHRAHTDDGAVLFGQRGGYDIRLDTLRLRIYGGYYNELYLVCRNRGNRARRP